MNHHFFSSSIHRSASESESLDSRANQLGTRITPWQMALLCKSREWCHQGPCPGFFYWDKPWEPRNLYSITLLSSSLWTACSTARTQTGLLQNKQDHRVSDGHWEVTSVVQYYELDGVNNFIRAPADSIYDSDSDDHQSDSLSYSLHTLCMCI